jgi:glutamate carboxypeptidase
MTRFSALALSASLALCLALPAHATTHQKLLAAASAAEPAVIESLHAMVGIESGSDDAAGLEKMAQYVSKRLKTLGATVKRLPAANGHPPGLVEGTFKGDGQLRIMLIAHMDTVYREGILESEPWRRDGNTLYGPGIADDKGGIAVILHSIGILNQLGWNNYAQLTVLIDPDEEIGSPGSGKIIEKLASGQDVVLSYEPSPAKSVAQAEGVLLNAAGTATIKLTVDGRAAHAGAAAEEGRNALLELAWQLLQTRKLADKIPGVRMNWTTAHSGTARNQIPGHAEAGSDVRITKAGAPETLFTAVKAQVDQHHLIPDTTDKVSLEVLRPMFEAGPHGLALAQLAQSIYGELHEGNLSREKSREMPEKHWNSRKLLMIPGTTGGTDAGFAAASGKPAVLEGLGLAGWGYHAKGEHIEIDSIVPRLYLTARMLIELGNKADASKSP